MLKLLLVVAVFVAGTQASARCSFRKKGECLSQFRHLAEAKDSKEKICRVYRDVGKCLAKSHCHLHQFGGLFRAAHEACEGKCELTKVVACKLQEHNKMIMNNGTYCSYHPAYLKCYDNTDCEDLMNAEDKMMQSYCGSCIHKEFTCLRILKDIKKVEHSKEKICDVFAKTKSCLDDTQCHFHKYKHLVKAITASCEGSCDLPALVKCKNKKYKELHITKKNVCQEYPKFKECFVNAGCDELLAANKKFMAHFCHKQNRS
ncbi:uncharacterized protein LOC115214315 [Octopus sinensis]|uniref:Uncharacterized protein LOC115214315 n=1 Tax=Octopus sinensis TaxID=2607531 RepID=A0A6P7SM63_9MOLL|nr:uncharacterized protein LOC115214315 [Octopus sinensis]